MKPELPQTVKDKETLDVARDADNILRMYEKADLSK
jgi:hypothetical protein